MKNGIQRLVDKIEARSFNCAGLYLDQRKSLILLILLPIFQALDRIPVGRLPALEKDRQEGDQQAEPPKRDMLSSHLILVIINHYIKQNGDCSRLLP